MCVAIPGKIVEIKKEENIAVINFSGNKVNARTGLVNVKIGDYALVHAGCVIQVMEDTEAEELIKLFDELKM